MTDLDWEPWQFAATSAVRATRCYAVPRPHHATKMARIILD